MSSWSAELAVRAVEGAEKRIAAEVWPNMEIESALRELRKRLTEERGLTFRLIDALCKHGRRDLLSAGFAEHLRELDPAQLVDDMHQITVQLELFGARVLTLSRRVEEIAEVLPLKSRG